MSSVTLRPGVRPSCQVLSKAIAAVLRSSSDGPSSGFKGLRPSRLSVSGGAVLGAALVLSPPRPVLAQEQSEDVFEEITVTGSRIQRRDFTSNAPIQTVFIDTDSPYLSKGWPLWRLPPLPIEFSVRLGKRFAPSADPAAQLAEIQTYFTESLAAAARQP